ncbi:MAG TPA: class I adenylate-forming enzyme family protein [Ramlibacter sp.]|nr:class I adenylate-forming enzyme family protein [Ramlibacter sp.]
MNLSRRFTRVLEVDPAATAIEFEGRAYPWSYIAAVRNRLDRELVANGLDAGARVAVTLRNRPQHVATVTALLATERCVVTINPFSSGAKVADDIRSTQAPVLVADEQDWAVPEIRAAAQALGALGLYISASLEQPLRVVEGLERVTGKDVRTSSEGIAVEMLTSGTTGAPKRVALSYRTLDDSVVEGLNPEVLKGEPRLKTGPTIVYPPLVHIGGIFGVALAFYEPRPIALLEKFDLPKWLDLVRRYRPKFASLVPTAIRMILDAEVPPEDLKSLLAVRAGTAPLDQATQQAFEQRFGVPVLVTYGATEFAGAATRWSLDEYKQKRETKRGSVGRARPGFELRVIDRATGVVLPPGEIGVLEIKAARLSGEQWVRTTDLAAIDDDSYLFIHGRADEAIIRGGFKVLPEVVANVFRQHPGVQDAVVVALPDPKLGQVPGLAVEVRPGTPRVSEEELRAFAREHLVAYQAPARYLIVDELPRSAAMKVRLVEVHELFRGAEAAS